LSKESNLQELTEQQTKKIHYNGTLKVANKLSYSKNDWKFKINFKQREIRRKMWNRYHRSQSWGKISRKDWN